MGGQIPNEREVPGGFFTVTIADTGDSYRCSSDESLLEGMRRLGKRGIPVGSRGGGCSVCKVAILSGAYQQFRPMSREYVSDEDLAKSRVLACCIKPTESVTVQVVGKLSKCLTKSSQQAS